ncbi:DUF6622 family protein [Mitsuaria sp. 7]|uniref:DUF6622 family protein n=1 Tax=Mitsuaria sp. 7 TaxID=1658665 RepID=UPI00082C33BA|nr:DUF6622 family protein [Mitsuaria sp. 7]
MHPTPLQILSHIPGFVWAILAMITYFGIKQSTATAVRAKRLIVLPALWLVFGAWGVEKSFGLDGLPGLAWLAGIVAGVLVLRALRWPGNVRYDAVSRRFLVPGSWVPMALMMGIFVLKFASGMSLALHPDYAHHTVYALSFSAAFGLFSGAFLGRAINILSHRPQTPDAVTA